MASQANFQCSKPTFHLHNNLRRRYLQKSSSLPFSINLKKSTLVRFPVIRASSSSSPSSPKPSLLKTTFITFTAAASLFSALYLFSKSVVIKLVPISAEEETTLEKHLETESNDVDALLSLAKIKFDSGKREQAVDMMNRLIEIDPDEQKWPVMKARMLSYHGESESAIKAFEEILLKDPIRVDAYHYLVMEHYNSKAKLTEIEKRINEAIRRCEKEKKTKEVRGFSMLMAQIRVIEGKLAEAIWICEQVVKDDPRDFRIYLFQGLVYSLMKKGDEAAKQFEQVSRLLPDDPYVVTATTNTEKVSEWRVILTYDNVYCYLTTFAKLFIDSAFEKFS